MRFRREWTIVHGKSFHRIRARFISIEGNVTKRESVSFWAYRYARVGRIYLDAIAFHVVAFVRVKKRKMYICVCVVCVCVHMARIFWVILSIIKEFRSWRTRNASINSFFKRNFTLYVSCKQLKKSYTAMLHSVVGRLNENKGWR